MQTLTRYAAGYVLDFFRERVSSEDFRDEEIGHVLVPVEGDPRITRAVRRLFPQAELRSAGPGTDLWRARRMPFDVACVAMRGGSVRSRLIPLLSGARHILLVPSPDYLYRLGLRRGSAAMYWALIDRFLLAPIALLWLGVLAVGAYGSGLVGRLRAAGRPRPSWRPTRVLLLRLMPTSVFVALLKRLRRDFPGIRLAALLASDEGRGQVGDAADEVILARRVGLRGLLRRLRRGRFDTVLLAGGADYGVGSSYLKAVLAARLTPRANRYQWETGQPLPGGPLWRAFTRAMLRRDQRRHGGPGLLGRVALRHHYSGDTPTGPPIVQIGLAQGCNYHCLFCPFHSPTAEGGHRDTDLPRMSFEMFARLLGDLKCMSTKAIDICGDGEPLMHPEALEMIGLAREMDFDVTLATNAALLTEARARRLVDLGVKRIHVSFNAATDDIYQRLHAGAPAGARRRIIARLRGMADYAEQEGLRPIAVEFSAVLNRLNMQQIPHMVEAAHEARAGWFMLILMGPVPGAEGLLPRADDWMLIQRDLDRALARARKLGVRTNLDWIRPGASAQGTRAVYERIPCHIGHEYALITADGSVMFCCQCSRPLGNLHEDSFREIWYSEAYRGARQQARELPRTREQLPSCECFTACSHVVVNLEVQRKLRGERALRSVL
jgi:MoaA/NifB/PqqE/SkfB family radical SAM enzyme